MCGIAGIIHLSGMPVERKLLERMTALLEHRGPDGEGFYINGNMGLGHRRLKIIDLSENGRQPMSNEDGSIWVTYNGEIYNFQTLALELEAKGHIFRSRTDTEVIVHAYEEWGIQCVRRFNGMFALALYDERNEELFLVRDRIGIKPLFYYLGSDRLLFASEIKAILADPSVPRKIDTKCVHNYFSLNYVSAPLTLFKNILQVLPGHYLRVNKNRSRLERYWDISFTADAGTDRSDNSWLEEFDHQLHRAVKMRLVSDVPFGAFLSGGLDSSCVVYYMTQIMKTGVKTFSIGFDEKSFDELSHAEVAATSLKTDHHWQVVTPYVDDAFIRKLVWHSEEPTADSSIIPMSYLAQMTRSKVTMALSGDGADEILAGYETYQAYYLRKLYRRLLPGFVRTGLIRKMAEALPTSMTKVSLDYKIKSFIRGSELPWQEAHFHWRSIFDEQLKRLLYTDEFQEEIGEYRTFDFIRPYFEKTGDSALNAMLEVDTKFYLPNDMLVKVDRASMAHSLEVRVPFLDHQLVQFVARMPERLKLCGIHQRKSALRSIMKRRLPKAILKRRKLGFNVPLNVWIQGPLREFIFDTLSTESIRTIGILEPRTICWVIDQHLKGKRDFGYQIWSLVIFVIWWNMFIKCKRVNQTNLGW